MDASATKPIRGKIKSEILAEAIAANGGPEGNAPASVRNYVDRQFPGFEWGDCWHAEIDGAQSAMLRIENGGRESSRRETASAADAPVNGLRRAREFIAEIGGGEVAQAQRAVQFLLAFGSLEGLSEAIELWSQLLEAVDGNTESAMRVLNLFDGRGNWDAFPRVYDSPPVRDAA